MLKSGGVWFLWKIHFCPNLGKKGPKIGYFAFFLYILSFVFPKNSAKGSSFDSGLEGDLLVILIDCVIFL